MSYYWDRYVNGRNGMTAAEVAAEFRARDGGARLPVTTTTPAARPVVETAGARRPLAAGEAVVDLGLELTRQLEEDADDEIAELLAGLPAESVDEEIPLIVPEGLKEYTAAVRAAVS